MWIQRIKENNIVKSFIIIIIYNYYIPYRIDSYFIKYVKKYENYVK